MGQFTIELGGGHQASGSGPHLVVSGCYAVGSPMTTLGAHVSAKLRCAIAWVRLDKLYYHRS